MNTLQGIFDNGRSTSKRNFIQENVRQLRTLQKSWNKKEKSTEPPPKPNKYQHITAKVPAHITASATSKLKDSSAHPVERTRNGTIPTRSSFSSGLSTGHSGGTAQSRSSTRLLSKAMPARKSRIYPLSAGNKSNTLEREIPNKPVSNGAVFHGKKANSVSKSLSAVSLSGSELPKESSDMMHRAVSENSISVEPVRSLGCQTVAPEDKDGIFNDGVIKYPSTCCLGVVQTEAPCKAGRPPTCDSAQQTEIFSRVSSCMSSTSPTRPSTVPLDNASSSSKPLCNKVSPPAHERLLQCFKDMSIGAGKNQASAVMNLKNNSQKRGRNKERIADILRNQSSEIDKPPSQESPISDPACPIGHVPLPETERLETLRILQKSYEDYIRQLNSLPVKTDTLKMRLRKIDLEKQLNKLEEGIKVFSRPKVFIKMDG
ncbi:hypothetical protein R5R35_001098 [Gryllus longicercus]|uniref:Enkurin domain-containing protein n=1 Tax=Gryllus longicercus TaxID=2509291 RepID=A0AAN9VYT6_9ORTH